MAQEQTSETLTMAEWESKSGLMFKDYVPNKKLTTDEVAQLRIDGETVGVDRQYREQWLKDNGYEVTRENLMDVSLTVEDRQPEE